MQKVNHEIPAIKVRLSSNKKNWFVTSNGQVLARPDSKQAAIDIGQALTKENGGKLIIYGRYGQIFSNDSTMSEAKERRIRNAIREVYNLPMPEPDAINAIVQQIRMRHPKTLSGSISHHNHSANNGKRRKS